MKDLLSSKNQWIWSDQQAKAFTEINHTLGFSLVLGFYSPTIVSADASPFGLRAVFNQ